MPGRVRLPLLTSVLAGAMLLPPAAIAQIPNVDPICADRAPATGASPFMAEAPTPSRSGGRPDRPASDLYCIDLFATGRAGDAAGVVSLSRPASPFGVSVTAEGRHRHELTAWIAGLPDPASLGPYTAYVAWATPLVFDPVVRLGEVTDGRNELGEVAFNKYVVLVSAEPSADVTERSGPLVLRGRSPSTFMEAHDLMALAPAVAEGPVTEPGGDPGAGPPAGERAGPTGPGGPPPGAGPVERAAPEHAAHGAGAEAGTEGADAGGWTMPPDYEGVPMLPGMMSLRPRVSPLRLEADLDSVPLAAERRTITLPDGGTLDLTAGFVKKTVSGRELLMMGFNGQIPGPLIRVGERTTIFVNFTNETPFPTAVHWHGVRLDNRYDGVPGVTQEPVEPGETFRYQVFFRDAGVYWYHPHHREDVQQELGLAGNLLVDPVADDYYNPVSREEVVMLDDLLVEEAGDTGGAASDHAAMAAAGPDRAASTGGTVGTEAAMGRQAGAPTGGGLVPFGLESANYALMGRFGNVLLANGEPEYGLDVDAGEVVRFYFTNASNTRTFNLSFRSTAEPDAPPLPIKVVGSDVGKLEREVMARSVVLAPAERYVVEVLFEEPGAYALVNHVQGINHRVGVFLEEVRRLGTVAVSGARTATDHAHAFHTLRTNEDVIADIDRYRGEFDRPIDHELTLTLEVDSLPMILEQSMMYDWVYFNPVEWTGTMPMMNWAVSGEDVRWVLRDGTGAENTDINWRFRVGDVVKIRLHNDRGAFHAMQHPLHIHGQRFLVLAQNGVPNDNLVWKDTVLLPTGSTTDILLELSNPGRWMVHCHIAEHLESGMKLVFEVEGEGPEG